MLLVVSSSLVVKTWRPSASVQETVCDTASSFDLTAGDLANCIEELQAAVDATVGAVLTFDFDPEVRTLS